MQAFLRALETKQVLAREPDYPPRAAGRDGARLRSRSPAPSRNVSSASSCSTPKTRRHSLARSPRRACAPTARPRPSVSIGAGSFAGGTLIPILATLPGVTLSKVCTASGLTARDVALRHGFAAAVGNPEDILRDDATNVVVIATRHDSHAALAADALRRGKAVFVEKPLALDRAQLDDVLAVAESNPRLTVGFNRRFSPHTAHVRAMLGGAGALVIHIRVNAGPVSADSWIHDPASGGGRLLGEVCHFIDLAQALTGARISRVYATAIGMPDPASRLRDNVCVNLQLSDGSLASIVYTSKGDVSLGKERIEVFGGGISAVIDDFRLTEVRRGGRCERLKTKQNKGHAEELARFIAMVTTGGPPPIAIADLRAASLGAIAALESLAIGAPVDV